MTDQSPLSPFGPTPAHDDAEALLSAERFNAALRLYRADPAPTARAYSGMAAAHVALAEFDRAAAAATEALRLDPLEPRALAVTGYLADVAEGDPRRAADLLRRAVDADPGSAYARYRLGALLLKYEAYDEARAALLAAQALQPANWRVALLLSRFAPTAAQRNRQRRAAYQAALRVNPTDARLRLGLLRALLVAPFTSVSGSAAPPSSETVRRQHLALQALFSRRSTPYLTYLILAINTIMLAVLETNGGQAALGVLETGSPDISTILIHFGAKFDPAIASGQWWRLLTPVVLHANVLHWGMNSFFLWTVGPLVERLFGRPRMLFLYLFAAICGNLASYIWTVGAPSVGASTALAGLLGALAIFFGRERGLLGSFGRRQFYGVVATALLNLLFGLAVPQVDNAGHAGGFVGGLLVGLALMPRYALVTPQSPAAEVPALRDHRPLRGLLTSAAVLALFLLGVIYITLR